MFMQHFFESKLRRRIIALIVVVGVFVGTFYILHTNQYEELKTLENSELSFQEYAEFFEDLAKEKGAPYAFDVLAVADIVPGIDIHLLGHVVGDLLYKQQGIDGIHVCTPNFRNACSHTIVIGLFDERGQGALDDISEVCRQAPGGPGAYTMCFHGLGHGVLAFSNYDFEQAVTMCKKTGTAERQNREYIECVGGVMMEMIAGVHDRNSWELQQEKYFSNTDPLAPCNLPFVPEEVRPICYTYLTPHLFESAGGDLGKLSPDIYGEAFSYCSRIPKENRLARDSCYGGFGKEFVVLAQGRDVRDIGSMNEDSLRAIRSWCAMADDPIGEIVCNGNALASLFWGGENNPDASFLFCAIEEDVKLRNECYVQLAQTITFFLHENPEGSLLCSRLPEPHKSFCQENI